MTADTFSSRSTGHSLLAKNVGRNTAVILGCKSHVLPPQKKRHFKICCPQAYVVHLGGVFFCCFVFFKQKSLTFSS